MADYTRTQSEDHGASGFVTIPAIGATALVVPFIPRAVLVQTSGDMAVQLTDTSSNAGAVVAVVAGQIFQLEVTRYVTGNTAVLLGLR